MKQISIIMRLSIDEMRHDDTIHILMSVCDGYFFETPN
jgi:hypothetical protein